MHSFLINTQQNYGQILEFQKGNRKNINAQECKKKLSIEVKFTCDARTLNML